jgi:tRNA threonylcarbamoyladenosine biosynthesis protein TsaE
MRPFPQSPREPLPIQGLEGLRVLSRPHATILESRLVHWPDEAACQTFARRLAQRMRQSPALADVYIELRGPLGAGKTTFARHLLRALGVAGRVKSPTFAVVEPYALPGLEISHFDFYRFDDPREWEDAGFREVFAAPGLKLAEWPEKAAALLPPPDLRLHLDALDENARRARVEACTPRGVELIG